MSVDTETNIWGAAFKDLAVEHESKIEAASVEFLTSSVSTAQAKHKVRLRRYELPEVLIEVERLTILIVFDGIFHAKGETDKRTGVIDYNEVRNDNNLVQEVKA